MNRVYLDHNATTPLRPEARDAMIAGMDPVLDPDTYHFCTLTDQADASRAAAMALASFVEAEGISLILSDDVARQLDLQSDLPMKRITLNVYSDLEGVGLTAAVAKAGFRVRI